MFQLIFLNSSRYFHWNVGLYSLLFMVIVLIPFYIAYYIISNIRFGKLKIRFYVYTLQLIINHHDHCLYGMKLLSY